MNYVVNGREYPVVIERKNNKNTYIRIKQGGTIFVTTNYFVSNFQIKKLLDQNQDYIQKNILHSLEQQEKEQQFYFLGTAYEIITIDTKDIEFIDHRIYVKNMEYLNKWLQKQIKVIFKQHLDQIYSIFEENIPYPKLRIRKMKTRWGVCNKKTMTVTLNSELIRFDFTKLDYVIVHELSHFIHFNHSASFWNLVSKYCPDYKKIRNDMKK